MSSPVKVILYVALALLVSVSGYFAFTSFGHLMAHAGERTSELEQIEPDRRPPDNPAESATNTENVLTNPAATNLAAAAATNVHVLTGTTNVTAATNVLSSSTSKVAVQASSEKGKARSSKTAKAPETRGRLGLWLGVFVISLLALGLLIASDVSHYFGNKALKVLYNDEGEGQKDPEYDKAEEVWANGDHLEAIRMMREYLAKNPREQHVAIRIAEIYEKDLNNNLAAALEYEEVLKQKLAPERWAWAAIHLCNLYFRLGQEQKGFDLLRRIVNDYPNTAAAEKARKRLDQVEGASPTEQIATEAQVPTVRKVNPPASSPNPPSNLPPGFRPKK